MQDQKNERGTSVREVAKYLGVSHPTVYKAIANRGLKAKKLGKHTIILPEWVDNFMDNQPDCEPLEFVEDEA